MKVFFLCWLLSLANLIEGLVGLVTIGTVQLSFSLAVAKLIARARWDVKLATGSW